MNKVCLDHEGVSWLRLDLATFSYIVLDLSLTSSCLDQGTSGCVRRDRGRSGGYIRLHEGRLG